MVALFLVGQFLQRRQALEGGQVARRVVGQQGGAEGRHQVVLRGDNQFAGREAQHRLEGAHDTLVVGDTALKKDRRHKGFAFADHTLEVARQSQAEARQDVGQRRTLLLQVDHVGLGENRTASGDAGRMGRLERQGGEFALNRNAEPLGLLVEKRAGASGTNRVHRKVAQRQLALGRLPVQRKKLAVLAANLDHGARLGVIRADRTSLGDQLVDVLPAQGAGDPFAAGAGQPNARHPRQVKLGRQFTQRREQRALRLPARTQVALPHQGAVGRQDHHFDRG